jgi:hypothetical protein
MIGPSHARYKLASHRQVEGIITPITFAPLYIEYRILSTKKQIGFIIPFFLLKIKGAFF